MDAKEKDLLGKALTISLEKIEWDKERGFYYRVKSSPDGAREAGAEWNPLRHNGDAFELAMDGSMYFSCDRMLGDSLADLEHVSHRSRRGYSETRLAIVLNAAKCADGRIEVLNAAKK